MLELEARPLQIISDNDRGGSEGEGGRQQARQPLELLFAAHSYKLQRRLPAHYHRETSHDRTRTMMVPCVRSSLSAMFCPALESVRALSHGGPDVCRSEA